MHGMPFGGMKSVQKALCDTYELFRMNISLLSASIVVGDRMLVFGRLALKCRSRKSVAAHVKRSGDGGTERRSKGAEAYPPPAFG
jgi:hypothetical protein